MTIQKSLKGFIKREVAALLYEMGEEQPIIKHTIYLGPNAAEATHLAHLLAFQSFVVRKQCSECGSIEAICPVDAAAGGLQGRLSS